MKPIQQKTTEQQWNIVAKFVKIVVPKVKKLCSKCHIEKTLREFYKNKAAKDGLTTMCAECTKEYNNKHRKKRDSSAYFKMWKERNPDYFKNYYLNTKK